VFIEKENVLPQGDIENIERIVKDYNFPWFYRPSTLNNFPYNSHALLDPNIGKNSPHYDYFKKIFDRLCERSNIKVNKILRMNINMSFYNSAKHADLHVDHDFPHKVMILYLNNASGNTLIFNETFKEKKQPQIDYESNWYKIQKEHTLKHTIVPKKNKVAFFDGINYHAQEFCKPNEERIIFICTFQ